MVWSADDFLPTQVIKGDYVGHPFRGNQWSDASGASTTGGETSAPDSTIPNPWGTTFGGDFDPQTGEFTVDEKGMNEFIMRQHQNLQVSESERIAVNIWQSYDYQDINIVTRGEPEAESYDAEQRAKIDRSIKDLNNIFTKATLDQDVTVLRGVNDDQLMFEDTMEGDIIQDSGFVATTLNPVFGIGASNGFIEGESDLENPLVFRILIPKGTPAFAAAKISGQTNDPNGPFMKPNQKDVKELGSTHSAEIVLPPNTKFKVTREHWIEFQRVLDLEVIPNA
jgi:hypothetical protein